MRSLTELLHMYADAFRELVNSRNRNTDKCVKEALRLNKKEDWSFICTAMDIVGDASLAIDNFLHFGLNGPTRYDETGEKYLRLYGVLNATYLQQKAIHNLFKLNNVSNPKKAKEKIESLKIREVRHKLGAHSNDYLANRHPKRIESYVPVRIMLSGYNCEFINNETLASERVNLKEDIEEHLKLMIELLDEIYEKAIPTFYKGNQKRINEFKEKLKDLRIEKKGGSVIQLAPDGPKLIITMRSKI